MLIRRRLRDRFSKISDMRDFRFFQGGVFTSILVFNMLSVANGWFIYDQTHDPMDLGWVGLCQCANC